MSDRDGQPAKIVGRMEATKAPSSVVDLEARRLEAEARKRLVDLRGLLRRNPEEARRALEALLPAPLVFTPLVTEQGKRYQSEGRASVAGGFTMRASPTGFEPVLQP